MDKQALRERIWDELEDGGEARFPFPPHGRIPNFAGADEAADRLQETDAWQEADVVKANPDAPQLPVRRAALRQGKTVYMAVPRLRDEQCFLRLDPDDVDDIDHATTVGGSSEAGVPVHPEDVEPIDLIVSGSVAVTEDGARIGKGEGYSDLEFAILGEFDLVDDSTVTATTVHELQVVDEAVPLSSHDVPMDLIVTPERTLETGATENAKPTVLEWDELSEERLAEIPILERLQPSAD
ncbi:5-formyltetrahydrofolate cyclo-ligase [Halopiger xanaduensis]|uniref:5-formyltetrahydrofolate cyclo-ligase n=1 Tax=Halopiger xanaduensis (strain DSM 18323 / JCM 14033 / SH-6) TaxID=797210 RepID=F8DB27_HALXS|nr:5-formyltetrahydrofolate cyclo-ligase [Halopiger xanaduensis]AEH38245.1 5-formyltetrahydrofolate cyclo-ligase [Halopiger xanaduensis SH-6]